jgi:hypothetical protein
VDDFDGIELLQTDVGLTKNANGGRIQDMRVICVMAAAMLMACTGGLPGPAPSPTRLPLADGIRHVTCDIDAQFGGETIPPGPEWMCIADTTRARQRWLISRPDMWAIEFDLTDGGSEGARLSYTAWSDGAWIDLDGEVRVTDDGLVVEATAEGRDVRASVRVE